MRDELIRKSIHIIFGSGVAFLYVYDIINIYMMLGLFAFAVILSTLYKLFRFRFLRKILLLVEHDEKIPGRGAITYIIGILLVMVFYGSRSEIVAASIMILAFADSSCALFGQKMGKTPHPHNKRKTIEGSVAGFIFGFVGAVIYVNALLAFVGAAAGVIVESIENKFSTSFLDDNITVPVIAGLCMLVLGGV